MENTKTLGNFSRVLQNQNAGSTAAGGQAWSIQRFDYMLITYLSQRFGDLEGVSEAELLKICQSLVAAQVITTPIVQNVVRLYAKGEGAAHGLQYTQAA
jgi:hypothetical protein